MRDLLCDPQTGAGLLMATSPDAAAQSAQRSGTAAQRRLNLKNHA
jgi:selenophosphate synthase